MKRFFFSILAIAFLLSSCAVNTASNITVSFDSETEPDQTGSVSESNQVLLTQTEPGNFKVGCYKSITTNPFYASYSDYERKFDVEVTILEYENIRDLLYGAKNGEFDLLDTNDTEIAYLFSNHNLLYDLESVLWEYTNNSAEYYTNIIDAGRINGTLQVAIPCFDLCGIRVPESILQSYGHIPSSAEDLLSFYRSIDQEESASQGYILKGAFSLNSFLPSLLPFPECIRNDYQIDEQSLHSYFLLREQILHDISKIKSIPENTKSLVDWEFQDFYILDQSNTYSVIPYPGQQELSIKPKCLGVTITGSASTEAAAYLQWVFSEEGQRAHEGSSYGTIYDYPMSLWVNREATKYRFLFQNPGYTFEEYCPQMESAIENSTSLLLTGDIIQALDDAITARLSGRNRFTSYEELPFQEVLLQSDLISNAEAKEVSDFDEWGEFCTKALTLYYDYAGYKLQTP